MSSCEVETAASALQFDDNVCSSPSQTAAVELDPGWLRGPGALSGDCVSRRGLLPNTSRVNVAA